MLCRRHDNLGVRSRTPGAEKPGQWIDRRFRCSAHRWRHEVLAYDRTAELARVVSTFGGRISQTNQSLGKPVHRLSCRLRMNELVMPDLLHALVDMLLDARDIRLTS